MIDFSRWIYTKDIAEWIANRCLLSIEEQMDCISSAPHRTMTEKLEGLKELNFLNKENRVCDKIEYIDTLINKSCTDVPMQQNLYGTEIFYHGSKEWLQPEGIFTTTKRATEEIKRQIHKSAEQDGLNAEYFYGVIYVLHEIAPYEYRNKENLVVNCNGEIIFCQPDFNSKDSNVSTVVATGDYHYLKIPYPSGTIVTIEENPFLPPLKGVIVNSIEPDETGFLDSLYNQWMIYPDLRHIDQTNGIGIVCLSDDHVPFPCDLDFMLSYKQFIRRYDGELSEKETWLREVSELVKVDKGCIRTMLSDRRSRRSDVDQRRHAYLRNLMARTKQAT